MRRLLRGLDRISVRLLLVHLVLILVPVAGLEFARIHERQLLASLERDMHNQAALVARLAEEDLGRQIPLDDAAHQRVLINAARTTRMRVRLLDGHGQTVVDSHRDGPPEGPEEETPEWLARPPTILDGTGSVETIPSPAHWPAIAERREVRTALGGRMSTRTRVSDDPAAVFLFVAEPIRAGDSVIGVAYVTRSTSPVLQELYRIRTGLIRVLMIAILFTTLVSLLLAWSISRPLARLSRAASRIAAGERGVVVPVGGAGGIRELGESFRTMTERLEDRLRYISDFAADVAHEFKSPLTSIGGAAELLDHGAADDPEARRRFLHNIELDVQRLDRLVSRLLELSRIEASTAPPAWIDAGALVRRIAARCATPDVAVEVRAADAPIGTLARETDLETALLNLVENAVRFSPPGKPVEIEVQGGAGAPLRIRVRDHGPGVPTTDRARIFDRFFTTDADRHGTGLGLAIAQSVARAHGGRVILEDTPGPGASFVLELAVRQW